MFDEASVIYQLLLKNRQDYVILEAAVEITFDMVMTSLSNSIEKQKFDKVSQFVGIFDQTIKSWAGVSLQFNNYLQRNGGTKFINLNSFQLMLRMKQPEFYVKLLLNGLTPLEDEREKVEATIASLPKPAHEEQESNHRHGGNKNGRVHPSN